MENSQTKGSIQIDAELNSRNMRVQLVRYHFAEPPNSALRAENCFRIELCLTARHRGTQGCFSDVWSQRRYEQIGDIFILPPLMELRGKSEEASSLKAVVCELKPEPIFQLYDKLPEPTDKLLVASLNVQDPRIRGLMVRLAEEVKQPGFASEILIEAVTNQLAVELFRRGKEMLEQDLHGSGLAPWQLRRIYERLNETHKAPTLSELSELCHLSVRQLARGFRASRGYPIGTYVVQSQMEHAKSLLAAGETVANISAALGFSSPSNFCAAFRRKIGLTPGQFRQQLLRS